MVYYYSTLALHSHREALINGKKVGEPVLLTKRYEPFYMRLMCFGKMEWDSYSDALRDYKHMIALSAMREKYKGWSA